MFKSLKKLFSKKQSTPIKIRTNEEIENKLMEIIDACEAKIQNFLITRSKESGVIKKNSEYSITKNAPGLFRLDSKGVSIILNTGGFITLKNNKLSGLLRISEEDLCRSMIYDKNIGDIK